MLPATGKTVAETRRTLPAARQASLDRATAVRSKAGNHKSRVASGVVRGHEVLRLESFMKRMGMTRESIINARRAHGMPVRKLGRRLLIHGGEFLDWVKSLPLAVLNVPDANDATEAVSTKNEETKSGN